MTDHRSTQARGWPKILGGVGAIIAGTVVPDIFVTALALPDALARFFVYYLSVAALLIGVVQVVRGFRHMPSHSPAPGRSRRHDPFRYWGLQAGSPVHETVGPHDRSQLLGASLSEGDFR